jgi:hypothetical protein
MFKAMEGRAESIGPLPRFRISRRNWPSFLKSLMPPVLWRQLAGSDPRRSDRRTRWNVKYIALAWILMGWSMHSQSVSRFEEARDVLGRLYPRRRRPGGTYQGFAKASADCAEASLRELWRHLRPTMVRRITDASRWYGWTVLVVDGSRFDAPRTTSNERMPGVSGRAKSQPQWNATLLVHLPTGLLWNWRHGSATESERGHLREMLDDLPPDALLLADAGYTGFDLMLELQGRGVTFVMRCGSNLTLLVEGATQAIERRSGQTFVYLWPGHRRRELPLCLRLFTIKAGDREVYLLTNELESTRLSKSMAAEMYRSRWGVEIGYRELKQTLDRRKLLSRSSHASSIELSAAIVSWAMLRLQACVLMGPRLLRLSLAAALRIVRRVLEAVRYDATTRWFFAALGESVRDDYERRRPKRARDWPHKKKESPPGPPNLRRITNNEITHIHALLKQESTAA